MKKILHISKYYAPSVGGIESIAKDFVDAFKGVAQQIVFCYEDEQSKGIHEIDGISVERCKCVTKIASQSISIEYEKKLKDTMKSFSPDIVVLHWPNPVGAIHTLRTIDDKTTLIVYWHSDIIKQKRLKLLFEKSTNDLLERANYVIATSPDYVDGSKYLQKIRHKCVIIPNCIDENKFVLTNKIQDLANEIRRKNVNKIICLAVGRHVEYKGFEYLIEASKKLDDKFVINIAGQGPLSDKLKKMAAGDSKICFLGRLSDEELIANYYAADIFCFPSITKNEAFGVALAEGMYFGKPAVTFKIDGSGVNYVSVNNVTGIEAPNKDVDAFAKGIMCLANDNELMQKMGIEAAKRVRELFLAKSFAENVKKAFGELLKDEEVCY